MTGALAFAIIAANMAGIFLGLFVAFRSIMEGTDK